MVLLGRKSFTVWKRRPQGCQQLPQVPTKTSHCYKGRSGISEILYHIFYVFIVLSQLMTWGAGKFGQLGNNCRDDSLDLQDITDTVPQEAGKIVQVCRNAIRIFLKVYEDLQHRFQLGVDTLDLSLRMDMHSHLVMIAITSLVRDGTIITYRRSGKFRVKKLSYDKFSCKKIFVGTTPYRIIVNSTR